MNQSLVTLSSGKICMDQWHCKFAKSFPRGWHWSMDSGPEQGVITKGVFSLKESLESLRSLNSLESLENGQLLLRFPQSGSSVESLESLNSLESLENGLS